MFVNLMNGADVPPGRFLNRNYRRAVDELSADTQSPIDAQSNQFPIERVRLKGLYFLVATTAIGVVGYGIALQKKTVSETKQIGWSC